MPLLRSCLLSSSETTRVILPASEAEIRLPGAARRPADRSQHIGEYRHGGQADQQIDHHDGAVAAAHNSQHRRSQRGKGETCDCRVDRGKQQAREIA
jgi:hypothetical protein